MAAATAPVAIVTEHRRTDLPARARPTTAAATVNARLRTSKDVFDRLRWSGEFDLADIYVGYQDRFVGGVRELPVYEWKPGGDIPFHRIVYFRTGGRSSIAVENAKRTAVTEGHWPQHATLLWDRERRIDRIFGSGNAEQQTHRQHRPRPVTHQQQRSLNVCPPHFVSVPVYAYDPSSRVWQAVPCYEDEHKQDADPSQLAGRQQPHLSVVTFNVLHDLFHSELLHSHTRWQLLLDSLSALQPQPDVIALQEVTPAFVALAMQQPWVQRDYFMSDCGDETAPNNPFATVSPFGVFLLTKIKPQHLYYHAPTNASTSAAASRSGKRILLLSLLLNGELLLVPVIHLPSNYHGDNTEKRAEQLRRIMAALPRRAPDGTACHALIVGDTNMSETEPLPSSDYFDCWAELRSDDAGLTYDVERNTIARQFSRSQRSGRFDRLLLRHCDEDQRCRWAPSTISMIGEQTLPIPQPSLSVTPSASTSSPPLSLFLSDHFGLHLCLQCRQRQSLVSTPSPVVCREPPTALTALALLPPSSLLPAIQAVRAVYDSSYQRWMPHINVIWGFVPHSALDWASQLIAERCAAMAAPMVTLDPTPRVFHHRRSSTVYLGFDESSRQSLVALQAELQLLFPLCEQQSKQSEHGYTPHCTIAQIVDGNGASVNQVRAEWRNQLQRAQQPQSLLTFPAAQLCVLTRSADTPFTIQHTVPVGSLHSTSSSAATEADPAVSAHAATLQSQVQCHHPVVPLPMTVSVDDWGLLSLDNSRMSEGDPDAHQLLCDRQLIPTCDEAQSRSTVVAWITRVCDELVQEQLTAIDASTDHRRFAFVVGSSGLGIHRASSDIDVVLCAPALAQADRRQWFELVQRRLLIAPPPLTSHSVVATSLVLDAVVPVLRTTLVSNTSPSSKPGVRELHIELSCAVYTSDSFPTQLAESSRSSAMDVDSLRAFSAITDLAAMQALIPPPVRCMRLTVLRLLKDWSSTRGLDSNALGYFPSIAWTILAMHSMQHPDVTPPTPSSVSERLARFFHHCLQRNWSTPVALNGTEHRPQARQHRNVRAGAGSVPQLLQPSFPFRNTARNVTHSTLHVLHHEWQRAHRILTEKREQAGQSFTDRWSAICQTPDWYSVYALKICVKLAADADRPTEPGSGFGWLQSQVLGLVLQCEREELPVHPWSCSADGGSVWLGVRGFESVGRAAVHRAIRAFQSQYHESASRMTVAVFEQERRH